MSPAGTPKVKQESNNDASASSSTMSDGQNAKLGCGPFAKFPILTIVSFAVIGIGTGYGLSVWDPSNAQAKKDVVRWVGLVGDMFLRMLKCLVLPLVFFSVVLSVVDMLRLGKARKVVLSTLGLYFTTTVMAAIFGVLTSIIFKSIFIVNDGDGMNDPTGRVEIACDSSQGMYMTKLANGTITCLPRLDATDSNVNQTNAQEFWLNDLDDSFVHSDGGGVRDDVSLSDTIYDGVFVKLISDNIVADFASANFGALIVFASAFGIALHRATKRMQIIDGGSDKGTTILLFFREFEKTLIEMVNWVLMLTPFAVWSLIAKALGDNEDLATAFLNVGYLICATLVGFSLHFLITYCGLFLIIVKSNPFKYLRFLIPAQVMAFASASSAATIPVNLQCVINSKKVKPYVAKFVVSLGATVNMDATAIYMIIGMTFLAVTSGLGDQMNAATYILMAIIATIGSAGTAPVPSASLVLIITAFNTCFNTTGTPESFSYILAIDWLLDRFRTVLNVTGDAIVCRMASSIVGDESFGDLENDDDTGKDENPVEDDDKIEVV